MGIFYMVPGCAREIPQLCFDISRAVTLLAIFARCGPLQTHFAQASQWNPFDKPNWQPSN